MTAAETTRRRSAVRLFVVFAFLASFLAAHAAICTTHEASASVSVSSISTAEANASSHCGPEHEHDGHTLTTHSEICFATSRDLHPADLPTPLLVPEAGFTTSDVERWCLPEPPAPVAQAWSGRALLTQVCITRV
ncbi:hypothetical protein [Saccharopolyspora taberi]|uniref:Secreted protein n=1 Tax=Saccharopolyspora taberi TaxID=60895 RepID=A0ABN3VG98_9PSEU